MRTVRRIVHRVGRGIAIVALACLAARALAAQEGGGTSSDTTAVAPASAVTPPATPALGAAPAPAPASASDSVFLRAQRLAAEGQGDAARSLVQRELEAAPNGSPRYVDALYWRAVVAATAADAERDLRTIIVDYPLSDRAGDALMRLAQLEMTRGDNDQALTHLQRVVVEHPDNPTRARASFWMARMLFDAHKLPDACRRLADASQHTPPEQIEQKNQIDFWMQRCKGVDTTVVAARTTAPTKAPPASAAPAPAAAPTKAPAASAAAPKAPTAPAASAATKAPAPAPAPTTAPTSPPASSPSATHTQYTVQIAAYDSRASAEALRDALRQRGMDARVYGTAKPFRVRVGRYDTKSAADAAAADMKAKKLTVFVTEAESR
ncbi:MAG TPA: SPOR domain-containing protein [Gemmatimonadaceae bacterium]|nr:SPOR domain-containing protein [Gemmatimonadaceae bacterium]